MSVPPPPYGRPPYGPPPGPYGPQGAPQPPYSQPPYSQPPYGQPPYGQPPYGQPPYGQPAYGPRPPYGPHEGPGVPSYPHARPEPFHRILRTWTYRPWRVLVGMLLCLTLGVVVAPFVLLLLVGAGVELTGTGSFGALVGSLDLRGGLTPPTLLVINLSLAAFIPITWLTVRALHCMRPRWLGSVRPRLRWWLLGCSLAAAVVATLVAYGVAGVFLPSDVPTTPGGGGAAQSVRTTAAFLAIIALTSPLQAAGEEYLFRGYLLQGFGALVRARWFTVACTSLLFAFAHGSQNLPLFIDRFCFGAVAGGLVLFTGGLEAGIAMHVVNNVVVLALAAATGSLPQTLGTSEASWSLVAVDLGQFALYVGLMVLVCRWRRPRTRTAGPPTPERAASPVSGPST